MRSTENSSTEEHKWRCLARYVCNLENKTDRRVFLERWQKRHGLESSKRLQTLVREEWQNRREQ